ncbi:serine--tRNA ligase, partial [Chloroflexota bacterium]
MLDLKFIRENVDAVREAVASRQDAAPLDEILQLDIERRQKVGKLDSLRQERKAVSKQREKAQEKGRALRVEIQNLEEEVRQLDEQLQELLLQVPNIPHPSTPIGKDDNDNVEVRSWGEPKKFDFKPLPHWELGESLGIIDFDRGVKISGSRFYVLKGLGARLQRALIAFMLDLHTKEHGYQEIYPPYMVKKEIMVGSGQLPK